MSKRIEKTSKNLLSALSSFLEGNNVLVTADSISEARTMQRYTLSIFTVLKLHAVVERHRGLQLNGCEILFRQHGYDPYEEPTDKTYILFQDS
jgi:2,3-bisphosphoglycerate-independent phosphoglycerate mutase